MTADQVRAKLHQAVSAGCFDELNSCRGTLHKLVNEWVDWAEVRYETERSYAKHDMAPPTGGPGFSVMFEVIGSVFYQALVPEASPSVAEERPTIAIDVETDPTLCTWSRCITHGCDGFCQRNP